MAKRIALVTGGTDGIGKETAVGLAKEGFELWLVGRRPEIGAAAVSEISERSSNRNVHFLKADLSLQSEIKKLSTEIHEKLDHIDLLVNNAGVIVQKRETTAEGFEKTFALNHLAYFSLTHLLLDLVKTAGPGARIVNTSSMAHAWGSINFDDLFYEQGYGAWKAYSRSKFANVLFTFALARRLAGTGITANCLHPGWVATSFSSGANGKNAFVGFFERLFAKTPEQGAQTSLFLCLDPTVNGKSGGYYSNRKLSRPQKKAYDTELQEKLWDASKKLTGLG